MELLKVSHRQLLEMAEKTHGEFTAETNKHHPWSSKYHHIPLENQLVFNIWLISKSPPLKFEKKINRLHCAPYYEEQLLHCPNLVKQTCQTSLQNQSIASVAENATALWSSRTASSGCLCIQSCLPPITGTRSMPCTPRAEPWKVEVDSSNLISGSSFRGLALRQPQSYTNIIDGNHQVFLASSFLSFVETFWTSVFVWSRDTAQGVWKLSNFFWKW